MNILDCGSVGSCLRPSTAAVPPIYCSAATGDCATTSTPARRRRDSGRPKKSQTSTKTCAWDRRACAQISRNSSTNSARWAAMAPTPGPRATSTVTESGPALGRPLRQSLYFPPAGCRSRTACGRASFRATSTQRAPSAPCRSRRARTSPSRYRPLSGGGTALQRPSPLPCRTVP